LTRQSERIPEYKGLTKIMLPVEPDSISPRNKLPLPTRCSCPTRSSNDFGRSRSASGATSARRSLDVLVRFGIGASPNSRSFVGGGEDAGRLDWNIGASGPSFRFLLGLEDCDGAGLDFAFGVLVLEVPRSTPSLQPELRWASMSCSRTPSEHSTLESSMNAFVER
jgi:hypothetical protein